MISKTKVNRIVLPLILVLMTATTLMAGNKVGYINLQRLVSESVIGKAAMADIERLRKKKQTVISEKLKKINDVKIDLETQDDLKDEEKKDRIDELNGLIKEYKRLVSDAKEEIGKEDRELVAQILKKADSALKKVAKKKKFTMIIKDPNAVGFLDPSVDITDDVLKELDEANN